MAKKKEPTIGHTDDCTFHNDRTRCTCGRLASDGTERGRPTKLTQEVQDIIVASILDGTTKKDAAEAAGVHYTTFNEWMKAGEGNKAEPLYSDFRYAIKKAEAECANEMAATVRRASRKSWQAAAWWLERRRRDDYALRREITGKDGEPFLPDHVAEAMKRAGKFASKKPAGAAK